MALYGLETLRITMENAWQYGDVECITEIKAINFDHDRIYPLCLIIEPNSIMPSIYEGWENYEYEVYFCMLWKKDNRDVSSRDLKWDNIQRIGNEWLDNVLNKYDNEDLILDDESLELERIKSFGNDKVLAIKFSFTLQAFRTCFNPKQFYVDSYYSNDRVEICVQQGDGGGGCDETISVPQCCRSWVRSDGWKEISFDNTLYNIMQFNDMSSYSGFIQPGIPPFDTLAHDFRVWNGVGKQNTTNQQALSECNSSQANNIHYADTLTNISDKNPLTLRECQYMNADGVSLSDPEQNQYGILNTYDWTIALVFTLDSVSGDQDMRYFSTYGDDAIANTISEDLDIYNDAGTFAIDFGGVPMGAILFTNYYPTIYTDTDKTVAMIVSYNSAADVLKFSAPNETAPTITGVLGTTADKIWGLKQHNLFFKLGTDEGMTNHYKGEFYEAVFYNYDLFSATDMHANKTRNPSQFQGQEVINSLGDKYGINP